jgi:hypothetical protein
LKETNHPIFHDLIAAKTAVKNRWKPRYKRLKAETHRMLARSLQRPATDCPFRNQKRKLMNTNDQTHMHAITQDALRRAGIAAVVVAMGVGTASAQMAPAQPAPVVTPTAPAAAPTNRAAGAYDATFKRIDADGDGFISKAELENADAKLGPDFQKYDTDGDGKLSAVEFETMMKAMRG